MTLSRPTGLGAAGPQGGFDVQAYSARPIDRVPTVTPTVGGRRNNGEWKRQSQTASHETVRPPSEHRSVSVKIKLVPFDSQGAH